MGKPCKNGDQACGDGCWYCDKCSEESNLAAYNRLTQEQKDYDNMVDPLGAYHTDYDRVPEGCSCHINPPCSYCVNKNDEDE